VPEPHADPVHVLDHLAAVHEIRRPAVVGQFLRRLRHGERELVEVDHGCHQCSFPPTASSARVSLELLL
jgi:hypothetical protein